MSTIHQNPQRKNSTRQSNPCTWSTHRQLWIHIQLNKYRIYRTCPECRRQICNYHIPPTAETLVSLQWRNPCLVTSTRKAQWNRLTSFCKIINGTLDIDYQNYITVTNQFQLNHSSQELNAIGTVSCIRCQELMHLQIRSSPKQQRNGIIYLHP